MEDLQDRGELVRLSESSGWNDLKTLKACVSGRLARFQPGGVSRGHPRKSVVKFEFDLVEVMGTELNGISLSKEDYDEMDERAVGLLRSLNSMANLDILPEMRPSTQPSGIGNDSTHEESLRPPCRLDDGDVATLSPEFGRLRALMSFLVSYNTPPLASGQKQYSLLTGPDSLFTLPLGDNGALAIGRLALLGESLARLTKATEALEDSIPVPPVAPDFFDLDVSENTIREHVGVVVDTIFREFRQLDCVKHTTHEIRLHVSDNPYADCSRPNLDMFVSCCPGDNLIWQSAQFGAFPVDDAPKGSICTAIERAMRRRERLHILVKSQELFDVTQTVSTVRLPCDNFDGRSLSELFEQGAFQRIEPQQLFDGTSKLMFDTKAKAKVALGLSRCLMDFFDKALDLASHSWAPDNIHFQDTPSKEGERLLYVSLRPNLSEASTSDVDNMFKSSNPVMLSFAKLLLELESGKPISVLIYPDAERNILSWADLCKMVKKLEREVFPTGYLQVVASCLDLWKSLQTFDNRTDVSAARQFVRKTIHREIVQKLELIVNPRCSKRKRSNSVSEEKATKRILEQTPASYPWEAPEAANFVKSLVRRGSSDPFTTATNGKDPGNLFEDYDDGYGVALYDEQEEEQVSNRSKAKQYFDKMKSVTERYIDPLKAFPGERRSPVKVAVLDSGIDMTDPWISARGKQIRDMRNWTSSEPNDFHDSYGHGTQVIRLLLQVAPAVEIYVAKVSRGRRIAHGHTGRIAAAIEWATAVWKVDMISLSLGLENEDETVRRALDKVLNPERRDSKKMVVVAAAANWGGNHEIAFPACYKNVICIHSTDGYGNPSPSNPTPRHGKDLAVLGLSIRSSAKAKDSNKRQEKYISGTSFATAIAAGISANVLEFASRDPTLSKGDMELLYSSRGLSWLLRDMAEKRDQHHYIIPWKLFKGQPDDIRRHIRDVLRSWGGE